MAGPSKIFQLGLAGFFRCVKVDENNDGEILASEWRRFWQQVGGCSDFGVIWEAVGLRSSAIQLCKPAWRIPGGSRYLIIKDLGFKDQIYIGLGPDSSIKPYLDPLGFTKKMVATEQLKA